MARRIYTLGTMLGLLLILGLALNSTSVQAQFTGSNWSGTYYSDVNFTTAVMNRIDGAINFNFGTGSPSNGIPADNFSIRWTGIQDFPQAGTYRFFLQRDDDAEVTIDGATVIPFQGGLGSTNYTVDVNLAAGQHQIVVSYKEFSNSAFINFYWQPITVGTVGPTFTPTRTSLPPIPPGALTATVIRASVLNIRDAPSLGGGRIGRALRGETYAVVGRDENARWFLLQMGGYQGWAWGYYLFINGNEFNAPVRSPFGTLGVPAGVSDTGVVAQALSTMRLRSEPNVAAAQIGRITWGGFLPVVGRTADGYWYQVVWKGTVGWVYSPYLKLTQGDLNAVPVR